MIKLCVPTVCRLHATVTETTTKIERELFEKPAGTLTSTLYKVGGSSPKTLKLCQII